MEGEQETAHKRLKFEWHQFQWPWVTSKPDFKVTVLFNVKYNSQMVGLQDRTIVTMAD